ncbi:MAG: NusA-like transcription termination signal-binding factor [Candidatus Pacearchaeota archaeon]
MRTTLDIKSIQQINLFSKITGVPAKNCFNYSNFILFVVNPKFLSKAMGKQGENIRKLNYLLKKKIKIIKSPDPNNLEEFVRAVVYPLKFKKLVNENGNVIISAGQQSKASLIGRNHRRLDELIEIVKQYFNIKSIRII